MKLAGLIAASIILVGCAPSTEELCNRKMRDLEILEREARADAFRANAECRAKEIEFGYDPHISASCDESARLTLQMSQATIADVDRRRQAPDIQQCLKQQAIDAAMRRGQPS